MQDLRDLIRKKLDPDDIVDILGLTTEDLIHKLWPEIIFNSAKFDFLFDEEPPHPIDNNYED